MNNPRVSLKFVALTALVALSAVLASGRAALSAQGGGNANNGEEFIFGTVGITASQTARLNVVNTATDGLAQTRVLKFLDVAGNVIVTKTVTLAPGESSYLDLDGATIASSGRVQIRALDPTCPTCRPNPTFGIIQTLEMIDTVTGRTDILYAPAQFLRPEGTPNLPEPFGMVGVIGGQTARLSVTAPPSPISPPNPVRVSLGFVRSDGQPIIIPSDFPGPTKSFTLQPGESVSLDLAADSVLADGETRTEIRPVVRPDGPPSRVIPTFEVIDSTTRKTAVLYAPVTRACGLN